MKKFITVKTVTVKLDIQVVEKLDILAKNTRQTRSDIIRTAIIEYLRATEKNKS